MAEFVDHFDAVPNVEPDEIVEPFDENKLIDVLAFLFRKKETIFDFADPVVIDLIDLFKKKKGSSSKIDRLLKIIGDQRIVSAIISHF